MRLYKLLLLLVFLATHAGFSEVPGIDGDEHAPQDREFVKEYPLADATSSALTPYHRKLQNLNAVSDDQRTSRLLELIYDVQADSRIPVVAQERILFETTRALGKAGSIHALAELESLAQQEPQAYYLVPGCRLPHPHHFYPFDESAREAINLIQYRDAYAGLEEYLQDLDGIITLKSDAITLIAEHEFPSRFSAALDLLAENNRQQHVLLSWQNFLAAYNIRKRPIAYSYALIAKATQWDVPGILEPLIESGEQPIAREAFLAWKKMRPRGKTAELLALFEGTNLPPGLLLAAFNEHDDDLLVMDFIRQLLADDENGASAALALRRIAPDKYESIAAEIALQSDAPLTARRRSLLLLRDSESPLAQQALRRFVQPRSEDSEQLAELRRAVGEWIK